MATYKGIQGYSVETLASDPTPTQDNEGRLWYNTSSNTWKIASASAGSWSSGGNIPTFNGNFGGCGTIDATIIAGGYNGPVGKIIGSFLYDGTSWSAANDLPYMRNWNSAFGTQTAAVNTGGFATPPGVKQATVEEYDGTSWTQVTSMPTAMDGQGTAGSQTAGLTMAGSTPAAPAGSPASFEYDGTNWTVGGTLQGGRYRINGQSVGTQTAALLLGGLEGPSPGTYVESYDGTSWSEITDMNTPREMGGGNGTQTSAIAVSGRNPPGSYAVTVNVEQWNGSAWTETSNVATGRSYNSSTGSGAGTVGNGSSFFIGGATTSSTPNTLATEEWSDPVYAVKTVTTS